VAIPRQPILSFVAQQVATIAEETPSGHWVAATFRLQVGTEADFQLAMTVC